MFDPIRLELDCFSVLITNKPISRKNYDVSYKSDYTVQVMIKEVTPGYELKLKFFKVIDIVNKINNICRIDDIYLDNLTLLKEVGNQYSSLSKAELILLYYLTSQSVNKKYISNVPAEFINKLGSISMTTKVEVTDV